MHEILLKLYKGIVILSLTVLCVAAKAQDTAALKPLDFDYFDRDLIPARTIYGNSWDSLHVDSPFFDPHKMEFGYNLKLIEEDCKYVHPFRGDVTSEFGYRWGRMHKGIDIDLETGEKVVAAFDGVVRISKYNPGGFGHYVLIRHYNGLETIYAHLSKRLVQCNQTVRAGEVIGYGGNTGRSTGSHLHFETRFKGVAFDPQKIIDFESYRLKANEITIEKSWFLYYTSPYTYQQQFAQYHKIRKGDTLYGIARKYGTTVNALCKLNRISKDSILRVGRTIRVR